jgi:hypothetical protein
MVRYPVQLRLPAGGRRRRVELRESESNQAPLHRGDYGERGQTAECVVHPVLRID